ncbi:MAG: hypothetical protein KDA93_22865 [Planctomycetaceae bacterium]|nr:hypothetical protein [Planctomycetaceae bacterium]
MTVQTTDATPDEQQSAYAIRHEMDRIRGNLPADVDGLMSNAQQLVDWRHYVQTYPWASLGVATALGYFAVPRKLEIQSPDAETLEKLAKENRLVVQHSPKGEEKKGVMVSMANLMGNMLLRAGMAYVGQQIGRVLGDQAADVETQTVTNS